MSDPFERLAVPSHDSMPDLDAIKLRAHRIQRRRRTSVASAGAAALAVIAVVGVLLTTNGTNDERKTLADSSATTESTTAPKALEEYRALQPGTADTAAQTVTSGESAGKAATPPKAAGGSTTASTGAAVAAAPNQDAKTPELTATLEVKDPTIGRGKTFTLKVCNTTSGDVKRSFGTSQRYDFEVSKDGKLVWRWSDGMMFSQVLGEETWKAKECKSWSADWNATNSAGQPVAMGDYSAVGILKSQPELRTASQKVSVGAL